MMIPVQRAARAPLHQLFDDVGVELALDRFDAFVQRLLRVVVEHRHGRLGQDRSVVDLDGDEMHGASGDLHAVNERVAHRVPALERGEQRRVRVDGAPAVRVDERLREDGPETGDRDEVDVGALECVDHLVRVRNPIEVGTERGAFDDLDRDFELGRDLHRAARAIDDNRHHREPARRERTQDRATP